MSQLPNKSPEPTPVVHPHENDVDSIWIQAKDRRREPRENNPSVGNVRLRLQFRCRGPRCESAVAQLFSLGRLHHYEKDYRHSLLPHTDCGRRLG
jgi:hypothetical protein